VLHARGQPAALHASRLLRFRRRERRLAVILGEKLL
jgi:hypothetical protein